MNPEGHIGCLSGQLPVAQLGGHQSETVPGVKVVRFAVQGFQPDFQALLMSSLNI